LALCSAACAGHSFCSLDAIELDKFHKDTT
jgi:hypothetical protein